jgi:uncharacterized protein YkvS
MVTQKLTSVKVDVDLFENFKDLAHLDRFTFQKLADRSMYLYITDAEFRKKIQNQIIIELNSK